MLYVSKGGVCAMDAVLKSAGPVTWLLVRRCFGKTVGTRRLIIDFCSRVPFFWKQAESY